MHLLTFRVIGHPLLPDSSWLQVGRGLNVLTPCSDEQARASLQTLQTINPPYDFLERQPFGDFPSYTTNHQYTKKIILSKKTAALAIFAAAPILVKELTKIDPIFYETDRIEFGRRRDHSRWINFIELSGSTRWSEIEPIVNSLLSRIRPAAPDVVARLQFTMEKLHGTDRIKDERAAQLKEQLQALRILLPENDQPLLDSCLHAVDRAEHFRQAKEIVTAHLPLFLSLPETIIGQPDPGTLQANSTPWAFLTANLRQGRADPASFEESMHQVNLRLQILHPEPPLRFRTEGKTLALESTVNSAPVPYTGLPPTTKFLALMSALAALHDELYNCWPIFLFNFKKLKLPPQQNGDLLNALLRYSSYGQCLVAPNSNFLAVCLKFSSETGGDNHAPLQFIPCS